MSQDREYTGFSLFYNDKRKSQSAPEYTGKGTITDEVLDYLIECRRNREPLRLELAGWLKTPQRGGNKFQSLVVNIPYDVRQDRGGDRRDDRDDRGRGRDDDRRDSRDSRGSGRDDYRDDRRRDDRDDRRYEDRRDDRRGNGSDDRDRRDDRGRDDRPSGAATRDTRQSGFPGLDGNKDDDIPF